MHTRAPKDHVSTMLRNGASLAEIEAFVECQPMPEARRGALWMRAWSERPDESVGSERRAGRRMSSRTQPLTRELWRADEPTVRKQPRWGRGCTINWADLGGGCGDNGLAELGVMAGSILRSRRISIDAGLRAAAYLAAALAFGSAAISLFWTVGGSWLLDTVGGEFEKLARGRSVGAMSLGGATVALKLAAGVLALALVRPWGRQLRRRPLLGANALASVILLAWGAANVCVGALVLCDRTGQWPA